MSVPHLLRKLRTSINVVMPVSALAHPCASRNSHFVAAQSCFAPKPRANIRFARSPPRGSTGAAKPASRIGLIADVFKTWIPAFQAV